MKIPAWLFISFWAVISITFLHLGFRSLDKSQLFHSVSPLAMLLFKHSLAFSSCFSSSWALIIRSKSSYVVRSKYVFFVYVFSSVVFARTIEGILIWYVLNAKMIFFSSWRFSSAVGDFLQQLEIFFQVIFRVLLKILPVIGCIILAVVLYKFPRSKILPLIISLAKMIFLASIGALIKIICSYTSTWIEKVKLKEISSQTKIVGTLVTVGGAMVMSLIKGPAIGFPWTHESQNNHSTDSKDVEDPIKGALMITLTCFTYSSFYILQAITLKSYPAGLSLTAAACTVGALIGAVLTFTVEKGNTAIWALGWNVKLLAYLYGGIFSSGIAYYLSGVVIEEKGLVFVTAFSPLSLIIVAILSSIIFSEQTSIGKVSGAMVIVIGLYMVIWGERKDQNEAETNMRQQKTSTVDTSVEKEDDSLPISSHNAM